jgi:predicted aminopeptidase
LACLIFFSSGCGSFHYLLQAGKGQLALINRARPIEQVLQDEKTSPKIKRLLEEIPKAKKYGEDRGGLKPTKNYTEYVKLDRPAAVWSTSACEPLEFKSKVWSFPFVGSFPSLGWFELKDAQSFAEDLRREGLDVDLRSVRAYSTLGWFRDAVLSSMISEGDDAMGELVNVILHESVHATFYVEGQSFFDESLASFVADELTLEYFDEVLGHSENIKKEKAAYIDADRKARERTKSLHEAYEKLDAVYKSSIDTEEKKLKKTKILEETKEKLKITREINNATLVQFKTYSEGLIEFKDLYVTTGKSWNRFWELIREINSKSFTKPQQEDLRPVLLPLIKKSSH